MAIAGTGTLDLGVVMIPKGMLAREKCDFAGIESQDAIFVILRGVYADIEEECTMEIEESNNGSYPLPFV
jgi:hypothetical protein